jgi:anti-sigma factor RsiW
MNHPNASDWIGLVRGEHAWLVAARLRRHLKHCPHCAVELKEITSMLAAAKPKEPVASKSLADKTRDALPLPLSQGRKLRSLGLVGGIALVAGDVL